MRSDVLTEVKTLTVGLLERNTMWTGGKHQRFRDTYCLHLHTEDGTVYFSKPLVST